jgi:peptidyl-prolyl cis-trans isomerase D
MAAPEALPTMQSGFKQIFIIGAILAIIFVFIIQFRPGTNVTTTGGPQCIAKVAGNCIEESDYLAAYRLLAPPRADNDDIKSLRMQRMVADGLVERWLLTQDAERLGISVSDDELSKQLVQGYARVSLPAAYEDFFTMRLGLLPDPVGPARTLQAREAGGKFDIKRYERTVREVTAKTPKDFREFQRKEMLAARVRELVKSRVRVSDAEARAQFEDDKRRATVEYAKLERRWYAKWVIDSNGEAVETWAKEHDADIQQAWTSRKEGYLPECRVARHILVKVDSEAADPEAAKKKARAEIDAARKRIEGGESFADVARSMSQDLDSRPRGGELGCVGKGKSVKPFEEALFALAEGKLSEPVESGFGMHLILVEKIAKDAEAEALGKKEVARELYLKGEAERLATEGGKQILTAVQGGKPLAEAVKAHVDEMLALGAKRPGEKKEGAKGKPAKPAKAEKKPEKGPAGEAPKGEPGEEEKPAEPAADETPTALTDPGLPKVETSEPFNPAGPPFAGIQDAGEATKRIFALDKPGAVLNDLVQLYDGYAVVQLKDKTMPTDEDWAKDRVTYLDGLRREKQRDALVRYVQDLRARYAKEVTYDKSITEAEQESKDKKGKESP